MKKGYFYVAIATFLFSTMEIVLKMVTHSFHPVQINFTRFFVGGLFLIPFAWQELKKKGKTFQTGDYRSFALLGFICVVVSMVSHQLAVVYADAAVVAVLFSGNPIFALLLAYLLLKEPLNRAKILALICEVAGIIIIINPFAVSIPWAGIFFTLFATMTFALYGVMGKQLGKRTGSLTLTCMSFLFGSLELLALILLSHLPPVAGLLSTLGLETFAKVPLFTGYAWENIFYMLYIFLCVTGIGYAAYFKAMEHASVATVSLIFFFKPILAPILAYFLIGEHISLNMFAGIMVVLIGSLFAIYGNQQAWRMETQIIPGKAQGEQAKKAKSS